MQLPDLVVGTLSIAVGVGLAAGAIMKDSWLMSLPKPRLLVEAIGPRAARVLITALGIGLIVLGVAIARGWRIVWSG
jgi:hypothetical protein